jgi:hypothetical protein
LHFMDGGILHLVRAESGTVCYYWIEPWDSSLTLHTGGNPFGSATGYANPSITAWICGRLVAAATKDGGMDLAESNDFGESWTEVEGATLVDDLENGAVYIEDGILWASGWLDDEIVVRSASGETYTAEALHVGGPTEATVCSAGALASGEAPRSQVVIRDGQLFALVETDSGANLYASQDGGAAWNAIAAGHIAEDLRRGNMMPQDGELMVCGHDGDAVQVESAFGGDRAPESWHIGGPTQIEADDSTADSAVEFAHGQRWVAVGMKLLRMLSPADGYEEV